jgi:hypothetical protein
MTNTATVSANQADPDPGDNVARVTFTVSGVGRPVGGYGEPLGVWSLMPPWVILGAAGLSLCALLSFLLRQRMI